jgi:hypothetical protein
MRVKKARAPSAPFGTIFDLTLNADSHGHFFVKPIINGIRLKQ